MEKWRENVICHMTSDPQEKSVRVKEEISHRKPFSAALVPTASTAVVVLQAQENQRREDHLNKDQPSIYSLNVTVCLKSLFYTESKTEKNCVTFSEIKTLPLKNSRYRK